MAQKLFLEGVYQKSLEVFFRITTISLQVPKRKEYYVVNPPDRKWWKGFFAITTQGGKCISRPQLTVGTMIYYLIILQCLNKTFRMFFFFNFWKLLGYQGITLTSQFSPEQIRGGGHWFQSRAVVGGKRRFFVLRVVWRAQIFNFWPISKIQSKHTTEWKHTVFTIIQLLSKLKEAFF